MTVYLTPSFHHSFENIRRDQYMPKAIEKRSNGETGNMFRDQIILNSINTLFEIFYILFFYYLFLLLKLCSCEPRFLHNYGNLHSGPHECTAYSPVDWSMFPVFKVFKSSWLIGRISVLFFYFACISQRFLKTMEEADTLHQQHKIKYGLWFLCMVSST